ncbi:3-phosphoshikimate 1-carboxyvinyltransferase [Pseudoflavonifractor sp. P01025]|uniref:3-phosphoshikimate 1-carboxyvinyltransferase n=1 Tax=Flintibacter porci TaxID=3342383 RepID=UPI0035B6A086
MNVTILPGTLKGAVTPPSSKSQTHRAVLALMLAQGEGKLSNLAVSEDIQATQDCVAALKSGQPAQADGLPLLDCGESGSTLRFLIPVALAVRGGSHFTGRGRLMERPQGPYIRLFEEKGILWNQEGACLTVEGQLEPGVYALPGNVSSQFITGLLYALPLLPGDSRIVLTTPLESRGYVDMTLDMLRRFDIKVEEQEDGFLVPGNQTYQARDLTLEADWSGAAFWYAANFLGAQVDIQGLNSDSVQGDRQIGTLYWKLARPGDVDIDLSQCPDLAPPLAAMAAVRKGPTRFVHAGRLRIKESDRLETIARTLNALGAKAQVGRDTLILEGVDHLEGGTVDGCNDHRIAMMAAVAAVACKEPVTILGAECVKKSYPRFWEDYTALGGEIHGLISG